MGQILVKDALARVSIALADTEPQFVTFTERALVDWMNDAARVLATYLPSVAARIDSVKLAPGTRQSIRRISSSAIRPGDGSSPTDISGIRLIDVVRNMGVDGATPGIAVRLAKHELLDAFNRNWHVANGRGVIEHYTFDPLAPLDFYVQPGAPVSPTVWLEIKYHANPPPIPNTGTPGQELYRIAQASTVTIPVPDQFIGELVNYVLARAWVEDPARAQAGATAQGAFLTALNAAVAAETGKSPNLTALPLAPQLPATER